MPITLGVSTGGPCKENSLREVLRSVSRAGFAAVELSRATFYNSAPSAADLAPFSYVSLHAPTLPYGKNSETQKCFQAIEAIHAVRPLDCVVFHPDSVKDFRVFRNARVPVAFENMDWLKTTHQDVEDMRRVMEYDSRFKFVLDLNHIYTNDQTLALAAKFYEALGSRIAEIHISGFVTLHEPLFQTKQAAFIRAIKNFDVPIILEGIGKINELIPEREYVTAEIENILYGKQHIADK